MDVKIRLAHNEDAYTLAELGGETYRETYTGQIHSEDIEPRIRYKYGITQQGSELLEKDSRHFLATSDGVPCGFLRLQSVSPLQGGIVRPVKIDRLYILKAFQGRGIGKLFMDESFSFAKESKASELWLSVLDTNTLAMNFYKKFGFKLFGEEAFVIGENTYKYLLMSKIVK